MVTAGSNRFLCFYTFVVPHGGEYGSLGQELTEASPVIQKPTPRLGSPGDARCSDRHEPAEGRSSGARTRERDARCSDAPWMLMFYLVKQR